MECRRGLAMRILSVCLSVCTYVRHTRELLQPGASFSTLMRDGQSPLYLLVDALDEDAFILGDWNRTCVELLQLMVKHGAMLEDDISRQSLNSKILRALATFDGKHEFVVDLLQAGAGLQLIASFCNALATRPLKAKSICMCQAAVLAGYTPSAKELRKLQWAAASGGVLHQLVKWLNEDRQQPPSLLRQCRVVITAVVSCCLLPDHTSSHRQTTTAQRPETVLTV